MNTAVIIAGGSGHRMGQDIPKQFIHINNKPILIYTLESFQNHPEIDSIGVVCIDGWHGMLSAYGAVTTYMIIHTSACFTDLKYRLIDHCLFISIYSDKVRINLYRTGAS